MEQYLSFFLINTSVLTESSKVKKRLTTEILQLFTTISDCCSSLFDVSQTC